MADDIEKIPARAVPFRVEGYIPPRQIPLAYRATLGLSAFAMVLLPLAYAGLILVSGWGVYLYAIHGLVIFEQSGGGIIKIVIYAGPLFAGATLVAFMVKPLFARPARQAEPLELELDQHIELRELIGTVCAKVGAPMPVRVRVDCQVNASAGLRRGLFSIGQRDLVLTIGLPLISGLSARQLAGILAHEFGHFSQRGGMAFTYIIRSINSWFARVVFERDHWDAKLEEAGERNNWQVTLAVNLARGAVWLSRRVLKGLMHLGHVITCLQLRQMEYDADYYEIQLVGTATFVETSQEMGRLALASEVAFSDLNQLWQTRQLVDSLPELVAAKRGSLDSQLLQKIDADLIAGKTSWLHTHPSNRDRIAQAERMATGGVLVMDAPAINLFPDFTSLAREATRHFYRAQLGLSIDESRIVSSASAEQAGAEAMTAQAATQRLTRNNLNLVRPVLWIAADFQPRESFENLTGLTSALAHRRMAIDSTSGAAIKAESVYGSILEHLILAEQAHALLSAGVKVNPRVFNLTKSDLKEAEFERENLRIRLSQQAEKLKPFELGFHEWICILVRSARSESAQIEAAKREEVVRLSQALLDLRSWFASFQQRHLRHFIVTVFIANQTDLRENRFFQKEFKNRLDDLIVDVDQAIAEGEGVLFPIRSTQGPMFAAAVLKTALEGVEGAQRIAVVLQTISSSYFRILGRLIVIGEELEKTAIPPISS